MTRPRRPYQLRDGNEPWPGESDAKGREHKWNNCTAETGSALLEVESDGAIVVTGGEIRHHQRDMDAGIGLDDLATAWRHYGYDLRDWSGRGWDDVRLALSQDRWLILQGVGNVPGAGDTAVPHAILVGPEKNLLGRRLIADPLYDDWQYVPEDKLKAWAQALNPGIGFAVSKQPTSDTAGGADVPDLATYLPGYTATIKKDASIRAAPSLTAQKYRGTATQELWTVTGWVKGEAFNGSTQWLCRWDSGRWEYTVKDNVTAGPTAPTGSGYTQAQLDAAVAAQKLADEAIKDAAVGAAVEAERNRISGVLGI